MAEAFDYEAVKQRRAAFLEEVRPGRKFVPYDNTPPCPSLYCPMDISQQADRRLDAIAWDATANFLCRATTAHLIDHAWTFGFHTMDDVRGFVTEPYIGEDDLADLMNSLLVTELREDWGLWILPCDKALSPWYPGETTPIMVTLQENSRGTGSIAAACEFLPRAIAYAFSDSLMIPPPRDLMAERITMEELRALGINPD